MLPSGCTATSTRSPTTPVLPMPHWDFALVAQLPTIPTTLTTHQKISVPFGSLVCPTFQRETNSTTPPKSCPKVSISFTHFPRAAAAVTIYSFFLFSQTYLTTIYLIQSHLSLRPSRSDGFYLTSDSQALPVHRSALD